jgi:hypothetical protein
MRARCIGCIYIYIYIYGGGGGGYLSQYSDWLRAGRSGDRIQVGARFSAPVQTGPKAHPASCIMGKESFPGVECGRGVTLTPHPLLVPRFKKQSRAITLLSLRAFVACKKDETYLYIYNIYIYIFTYLFIYLYILRCSNSTPAGYSGIHFNSKMRHRRWC